MVMQPSTFDEVLGLEEQFYNDGFHQGYADGINAGRIEGRTFGLEKGFEKYVESGKLYGKSLVWANRIAGKKISVDPGTEHGLQSRPHEKLSLPQIPSNQRLSKHLQILHAVSEAASLSTENTEEAVSDFDDRLKRAQAKAKLVERIVGESKGHVGGVGLQV